MSLQFIVGPSGSGKSHYLYQWVIEQSQEHLDKNYIVLVPEQFTMQTQKDLVVASPQKGILNIDVLSFHRLAYRIFEEVGGNQKTVLDEIGKSFVLRKVAGDCEKELSVLARNVKKTGFIEELKSIISEFTQYDVKSEELENMLEKLSPTSSFYHKLQDISKIYNGFQEYLSEKYITGEEILDLLCEVVPTSKILKNSVVVLDGFTGFTPVQNNLLRELLKVCEKVVVTVTMDASSKKLALFEMSEKMMDSLTELANGVKVLVDSPIKLYEKPVCRFKNNDALAFLEENLFRYSKKQFSGEQDSVQIYAARNPREEMDFVAQKIRQLVRNEEGMRYRDIAVITSDMSSYANYIEKVFGDYEIPVFMDHKRSILLNSFVDYLRSLLAMAEQNFTYESVFRYLRTGMTEFSSEQVDLLENYCLALGIRGYKKWNEKWVRLTKKIKSEELEQVNDIREQFLKSIENVMAALKSRTKTVESVTKALHQFLLDNQLQQKVKQYETRFGEMGELELEKEYAQVYRIVIELFDQFVELLGDERIALKEYCELFDAGLEAAKVGIIPPSQEQVVVGDIERTRIKDVKVVFFVGVNDIYIPGGANACGLLAEREREQFAEQGVELAPGAKEKAFIQKFYLYLIMTKPTEKVILTYGRTSGDGKAIRPAYLISELTKMYPKLAIPNVDTCMSQQELTPKKAISHLIAGLQKRSQGLEGEWKELYNWYKKNPEWSDEIEKVMTAAFCRNKGEVLSKEITEILYGKMLKNSVSRLEEFSKCAFAHFVSHGLYLEERELYQFQSLDLGKLLHRAMEHYAKMVELEGLSWDSVSETQRETFVEECIEKSIVDYENSILYSSDRNQYMITRMKSIMKRSVWALTEQLEKGNFSPSGYEVWYDYGVVELDDKTFMQINGKIDRVDVCETEDHVYVKVIDYKTGNTTMDLGEFYHGIQMQLVVYMNAAMKLEKDKHPNKQVIPAAIFYFKMQDPLIAKGKNLLKEMGPNGIINQAQDVKVHLKRDFTKKSEVMTSGMELAEDDFKLLSQFADKQMEEIGSQIMNGEISVSPYALGDKNGCTFCTYKGICGFDEKIPGYNYRKFDKLSNEEVLNRMREEAETWESNSQQNNNK